MGRQGVVERFMQYVSIDTRSREHKPGEPVVSPSSDGQVLLLKRLQQELFAERVIFNYGDTAQERWAEVHRLDDGSLLVRVPGNLPGPHLAFSAHVDTHPNNPGRANPMVHFFEGKNIVLPVGGVTIPASALAGLEGKSIITSDGSSLLGGDDKAGVAALMDVLIRLVTLGVDSGPVDFWFTVDEEVGGNNISALPADIAREWDVLFTVDGDAVGTVDVETMAGGKITVEFKGADAHPGDDGASLHPAHYAAARLVERLSRYQSPWNTSGWQSFYYASAIEEGGPNLTRVLVYPRSFDPAEIVKMAHTVGILAHNAAKRFGVTSEVLDEGLIYTNTVGAIKKRQDLLGPFSPLAAAHQRVLGHAPKFQSVRAGTDGSTMNLFYPDLPAPNLGAGARRVHSREEFVVLEELVLLPEIILAMIAEYAKLPWPVKTLF